MFGAETGFTVAMLAMAQQQERVTRGITIRDGLPPLAWDRTYVAGGQIKRHRAVCEYCATTSHGDRCDSCGAPRTEPKA